MAETKADAPKLSRKAYEAALKALQVRLTRMQNDIRAQGSRVLIIFEGRDAAGKGGTIKRITAPLNPRAARVVALPKPTEREQSQWYFQRYIPHLPAAGEMVLFDRSWYNRAGVEPVMGFCTEQQHQDFLHAVPAFEKLLVDDGIQIIKYWFSVSAEEQEARLQDRASDPTKRWKISSIDVRAREKWQDYSRAKDLMFEHSHRPWAPWYVVDSDVKKRARLNCISHLLSLIPHEPRAAAIQTLPPRTMAAADLRRSGTEQALLIPEPY
jgi:polyphosphate kinase 2